MSPIINALKGTPWWVYVLFAYLIFIGIKSLKPHVISLKKIFILPLIFSIWSIWKLIALFQEFQDLIIWLIAVVIGYIIGRALTQPLKIQADKKKLLIGIPGRPTVLIFVLIVFGIKYFFGYYSATHPLANEDFLFHTSRLGIFGAITGIFIGRVFTLLKKFGNAKHMKLKESK